MQYSGINIWHLPIRSVLAVMVALLLAANVSAESPPVVVRQLIALEDIRAMEAAMDHYRLDIYRYPTSQQGLQALVRMPAGLSAQEQKHYHGPYLHEIKRDPWGHPYVYKDPGNHRVHIISYGRDGKPGGEGEDKDIINDD